MPKDLLEELEFLVWVIVESRRTVEVEVFDLVSLLDGPIVHVTAFGLHQVGFGVDVDLEFELDFELGAVCHLEFELGAAFELDAACHLEFDLEFDLEFGVACG